MPHRRCAPQCRRNRSRPARTRREDDRGLRRCPTARWWGILGLSSVLLLYWGPAARADEPHSPALPGANPVKTGVEPASPQWAWVRAGDGKSIESLSGKARFTDGRLTFACQQMPRVLEAEEIQAIELRQAVGRATVVDPEPPVGPRTDGWWILGTGDDRLWVHGLRLEGERWEVSLGEEACEPGRSRTVPRGAWRGVVRGTAEQVAPRLPAAREFELDLLALAGGEEVYGQLEAVSAEGVRMSGVFGSRQWSLDQVRALRFRRGVMAPRVATGCHVRLRWSTTGDQAGEQELQSLSGVLTAIDEHAWQMVHAQWGELAIQVAALRRVEVEWVGARWLLDPHGHHLGNEADADFEVYAPESNHWEQEFLLEAAPVEPARLTFAVQDLEPFDSPHLIRTTSEGHLQTRVELNGRSLDTLNRHVRGDAAVQRVHLPIPRGWLVAGENRLVIRQAHARDDAAEYDDCQLGPVWLEVESRP